MPSQVQVTYVDYLGKTGVFGFLIDPAYDATPWTELNALLNALRSAAQCQITKVTVARLHDISGLTNPTPEGTTSDGKVAEQAILAFRAADGTDLKISIPGPKDANFLATGAYGGAEIDPEATAIAAIIAAGATEPVLSTLAGQDVMFRKGWRKGMPHP